MNKWHNLKENPSDVPKDENKKLVITEARGGKKNYVLAYYYAELKRWASGMNSNVVAWMELEPPEEVMK